MTSAQAKQARQANKKRRPPDFHTGDLVFVTKKLWRTDRPSDKLDNPVAGPFRILEMVGHSYRLELPSSYRISPVLHADRLRKADNNPLPGQIPTPPPAVEVDGDLEWEVEKILSSRLNRGQLEYKIQWQGWDPDDTWYPAGNLRNAPLALKTYHDAYPQEAGPPVRLQHWLDSAMKDEAPTDHPDDNKASSQRTRRARRRLL